MKSQIFKFFVCYLVFFQKLIANISSPTLDSSRDSDIPAKLQATFSSMESLAFSPQVPKVNVVTGEYFEEECDLLVAGAEPLSINRFYNHFTGLLDRYYGHWRINPETFMLFNFEPIQGCKTFAATGERNSSFFVYEKPNGNSYQIDTSKNNGFTNSHSPLSGQNHPLNTNITYNKGHTVRKNPKSFTQAADFYWWEGTIKDGSGRQRIFKTDVRQWPQDGKEWPCRKKKHPCSGEIKAEPIGFSLPFQAQIAEERLPNGNVIHYEYEDINANNHDFDHDSATTYVLKTIKAYSRKGVFLGSIQASYLGGVNESRRPDKVWMDRATFVGSDGRKAIFFNDQRNVTHKNSTYDTVLNHVESSGKPSNFYNYQWQDKNEYFKSPFISQAWQGGKFLLETFYDKNTLKVSSQCAPVGPNGQMHPIASYEYHNDHTIVRDGEKNKTVYRYSDEKRITAIEKYQGEKLYSADKNVWDPHSGNLIKKTLEDATGKIYCNLEFEYDQNHNAISQKKTSGFNHGQDVISRSFSDDGFNLKLTESDRPGKVVKYTYVPGTNLLLTEFTYVNDSLCKRIFHFYDTEMCSVRLRTIVDDGNSNDPQDLNGVTFRKIMELYPRRTVPCAGLPEEIRELTIDAYGNVILLKKVRYIYHPSGKIGQEDHYDANNVLLYSLTTSYDGNELPDVTTDCFSKRTTYDYDSNFNLISQSGPRADVHKEWVYDAANRPVQQKEWQSDGTVLVTEKKYDKASRVISSIDECGFETTFEHDSLGRVIATHHPDGASERKEYDIQGNVTQEIDANGYATRREFNFRGQPTAIYRPDGSYETYVYNSNGGSLKSRTDSQGTKILYFYDLFDRPIREETYAPNGELVKVISSTYSAFNKLSETDGEGNTTTYKYDYAGRKIGEEKNGKRTLYFYDACGRLHKTQDGDALYESEFDLKGQLIKKKTSDLDGNVVEEESYNYDEMGNRTHVIHSKGTSVTYYNSSSLPIAKKDALGYTSQIKYEYKNGFKQIETDPLGIQTVTLHDSRGNVSAKFKQNGEGQEIQRMERLFDGNKNLIKETHFVFEGTLPSKTITHEWMYGPCNRIEKLVEAGQKVTSYIYDNTGRLVQLIKPDQTALKSEYDSLSRLAHYFSRDFDYKYTYDKNDRILLVSEAQNGIKTTRSYDPLGNMTNEKLGNGLSLSNIFDIHGRRTQTIFPDGSRANYSYKTNRLYQVERNGLKHTYAKRDLEGNVSQMELAANVDTAFIERDVLGRWKKFKTAFYSSEFSHDSFDPVGNLRHYQYTDALGTKKCSYTYDALRQLTSEDEHNYACDSLHNRLAKDENLYSVNNLCEITHDGKTNYEYDLNGNLTYDGTSRFAYDNLDRLITVQQGPNKTLYSYDAFNRRLSKTLFKNNKKIKTDLYFYDGDNEIGCADEKGNIKELRILGEGFGAEIGASVLIELDKKSYIPIHDHRGCIVALVNATTKKVADTYRFTAFGEELTKGTLSPWRFASKRIDPETGFVYFGRRYYNAYLGRWITPDPKGFEDGPNLYAYVHNGPLTAYDLYGLLTCGEAWEGFTSFWGAIGDSLRDMAYGAYEMSGRLGEWLNADQQYANFNDSTAFNEKARKSLEGWQSRGDFAKAAYNDPSLIVKATGEAVIPGILELFRNPSSPEAWGRATVDAVLIGFSVGKVGQLSRATKAEQLVSEVVSTKKFAATAGEACNRATHEMYKNNLRANMAKPYATDPKLNRILDYAYRPNGQVGSGSAAAAIRNEKITGLQTKGCYHSIKGNDVINSLENWLIKNPTSSPVNRAAAENVLIDTYNSLK